VVTVRLMNFKMFVEENEFESEFEKVDLLEQAGHIENNLLNDVANQRIIDYRININYNDKRVEVFVTSAIRQNLPITKPPSMVDMIKNILKRWFRIK